MGRRLKDLRRLSHISFWHRDRYDDRRVESLGSAGSLDADKAIVSYRRFKGAEKEKHSKYWQAERWVDLKLGRDNGYTRWIDVCAYCTGKERERTFP